MSPPLMVWFHADALIRQQVLSPDPQEAIEQARWLGRYGLTNELEALADRLRPTPQWSAAMALSFGLGWLIAGDGRAADRAFLEADRLDPAIGLVPDPWGLWPAPEARPSSATAADLEPIALFHRWRWLDPGALAQEWKTKVSADWREALTPEGLDGLALLVRQREALGEPLEPFLAQLVPEAEMAADPASASRFWGFLCDLWPDWSFARLKAAELALGRGDHDQAGRWLEQASEADQANGWHWDLSARQALAAGQVSLALDHWGEAVRRALASGEGQAEELAELFRQRRREARRGPGLLMARSLLNRDQTTEARVLLEQLLEQDPQWQPLRALLDQVQLAANATRLDDRGTADATTTTQLDRFAALLDRTAKRRGLPLPQPTPVADPTTEINQQLLARFAGLLSDAEVRLALAA